MLPRAHYRLAAVILSALMIGGCATSASQVPATTVTSVDPGSATATNEVLTTELLSEANDLNTIGADGERVFGWNLLVGPSTFQGEPVQVRLQGSVEYVNGSGPFGGFLRIVAEDGSQLALQVNGQATKTEATTFDGRMDFIGASGRYADLIAAGRFTGTRQDQVGSPVVVELDLTVDSLDSVANP